MAAAHEALDGVDGAPGVGDGLTLGRLADEGVALGGEADDRRGQPAPLLIGDDRDVGPLHDGHDAVGRPQVDADDLLAFSHVGISAQSGWMRLGPRSDGSRGTAHALFC